MNITEQQDFKISNDTITPAEELFMYYKQGTAGSGMTALIDCIFKLDNLNQARIALGFPELVTVCNRYREELGYWEDLQERFKRS
jgi:hypothetical protein